MKRPYVVHRVGGAIQTTSAVYERRGRDLFDQGERIQEDFFAPGIDIHRVDQLSALQRLELAESLDICVDCSSPWQLHRWEHLRINKFARFHGFGVVAPNEGSLVVLDPDEVHAKGERFGLVFVNEFLIAATAGALSNNETKKGNLIYALGFIGARGLREDAEAEAQRILGSQGNEEEELIEAETARAKAFVENQQKEREEDANPGA